MDERVSSEVLAFAPKQKQRDGADSIDQAGQGVLALVQQAANISKENADRAMSMAHRLSLELRAAEDRIAELQAETERLQTRAARAEQWLEAIKNEIEDKLIAPMESNRREPPAVH
jgi:chromosome segregation ATPase